MSDGLNPAPVTYAERWDASDLRPIGVLSEAGARMFHDNGSQFVVYVGGFENPSAIIEIEWKRRALNVYFADSEHRRLATWYEFQRVDDSTLYMTTMTVWRYESPGPHSPEKADFIDRWVFTPTGRGRREFFTASTKTTMVADYEEANSDNPSFWEPVPDFGDWASVSRLDRNQGGQTSPLTSG